MQLHLSALSHRDARGARDPKWATTLQIGAHFGSRVPEHATTEAAKAPVGGDVRSGFPVKATSSGGGVSLGHRRLGTRKLRESESNATAALPGWAAKESEAYFFCSCSSASRICALWRRLWPPISTSI